MEQIKIQSSKIKCAGCVSNIEKGLNNITGIKKINVDIESNVVNIEGEKLDKVQIEAKLSELGYPTIAR